MSLHLVWSGDSYTHERNENKPRGIVGRPTAALPCGMREEDVTFTFLEDGFYLPSIGVVLPEGEYRGRITRDTAGKLIDVMLLVPRAIAKDLALISTQYSIISDYRSGLVREDRQ